MLPVVFLVRSFLSPMNVPPRASGVVASVRPSWAQQAQPSAWTSCGSLARVIGTAVHRPLHWPSMTDLAPAVWVIVPTYDEADNIRPITAAILEVLPGATVLVVDDGSPDGTGQIADELA